MPHEKIDMFRPTAEGLTDNIVRFSNLLRDKGVSVSLPAVLDSLKGLPLIDISALQEFRMLLQSNLVHRKQDIATFNRLFQDYWLLRNRQVRKNPSEENLYPAEEQNSTVSHHLENIRDGQSPEQPEQRTAQPWALRYSPQSLLKMSTGQELQMMGSSALYDALCALLKPLNNRLSRRYRYTIRGREISLRRILRKNLQFGGELIFLTYKRRKVKKRCVLFFCDVSGSMDIYTRMILQFVHALHRIDRRTEIFFFSTELTRATIQFDVSDVNSAISRIPELTSNWGGGTRIGHCLQIFNESYAKRVLSTRDIVIIFSDGWDRGEIDLLETQMACIKRKSYKIIWLNPLMGSADYQPTCQGMRTALPYVDTFLPINTLRDLTLLGHMLGRIMA
jgi:uncharacterized protein with von Willebrand factor type A (vWA) domain